MDKRKRGFSLIDLLVSLSVSIALVAGLLMITSSYQNTYSALQNGSDLQRRLRGATELLQQEIGQAGYFGLAPRVLQAAVAPGPDAQHVAVSSVDSLFAGARLYVGTGPARELIEVEAVGDGTLLAKFSKSHNSGSPVLAAGLLPEGILPSSSSSELRLLGDINGEGRLVIVQYQCDAASSVLRRTITPIDQDTPSSSEMLSGLIANAGGQACFEYDTVTAGGFTVVREVRIHLTIRAEEADIRSQQFAERRLDLTIKPRNLEQSLVLLERDAEEYLQPTPAVATALQGS